MGKKLTIIDGKGKATTFKASTFSKLNMTTSGQHTCVEKTGPLGINKETTCITAPVKSCGSVKVSSDCDCDE